MVIARSLASERLDDLTVHGPEHERVLSELARINRWFATSTRVVLVARSITLPRHPHIVDIGCGGGDVLAALGRAFPGAELTGIDGNPATIAIARRNVNADFIQADILDPEFLVPRCDLAVSTHFLYHLSEGSLGTFVARQPVNAWIIAELRRSRFAASAFGAIGQLLFSEWTTSDGVRAVRRAWTLAELRVELGPGWDLRPGPFEIIASRSDAIHSPAPDVPQARS